ncbi:MAG: hypothetical protein IPG84_14550 [Betaproteobacteria bacterium]|nr:hypothetical protein [Betaproteobacteria bacterium]
MNNDDANESPYTFVIQAAAGAPGPEIGITGNGVPIMDGDHHARDDRLDRFRYDRGGHACDAQLRHRQHRHDGP